MFEMLNMEAIPTFLMLFARVGAFFVVMPLFSYRTIPAQFKVGITFFLALTMFYTVDPLDEALLNIYPVLLLKEVLVGLFIGLLAYIVLSAVQIAGGFIDFQMGFAIANVIDPQTGAQSPLTGQYFNIIALLFLLSVNGHHLVIDAIYNSYALIPLDEWITLSSDSIITFVVETFNEMFIIAFEMAVPIVGCLFLVDVALGMIARAVPQLNVFVVGLPLKIFVSFVVLFVFMTLYMTISKRLFSLMFESMQTLMQLLGGG